MANLKKNKKMQLLEENTWENNLFNSNLFFFTMGRNLTIFNNIENLTKAKMHIEKCLLEKTTWYALFLEAYLNMSAILNNDDKANTITLLEQLVQMQNKSEKQMPYYIMPYLLLLELQRDDDFEFAKYLQLIKSFPIDPITVLDDVFVGIYNRTYSVIKSNTVKFNEACDYLKKIKPLLFEKYAILT